MNNLKKSIEKDYKDVQDFILLENYEEAIELMYLIVQKLVYSQMDDACLISKGFESDLKTLYGAKLIEKGSYDNYSGIVALHEMLESGNKPPVDTIKMGASILQNEIDYTIRRSIMPQQDDISSGSYAGNIDFPLGEGNEDENEDAFANNQNGEQAKNIQANYQDGGMFTQTSYNPYQNEQENSTASMFAHNKTSAPKLKKPNINLNIKFSPSLLIKILVPIVCIVIIVLIVRSILPSKPAKVVETETTLDAAYESIQKELESMMETSTTAPSEAGTYVVTGDAVKLRYDPNTSGRVYTTLNKNVEIKVIKFYDSDWALVEYDGKNLYISRNYIQKIG